MLFKKFIETNDIFYFFAVNYLYEKIEKLLENLYSDDFEKLINNY